jgi:hypothetical protein
MPRNKKPTNVFVAKANRLVSEINNKSQASECFLFLNHFFKLTQQSEQKLSFFFVKPILVIGFSTVTNNVKKQFG